MDLAKTKQSFMTRTYAYTLGIIVLAFMTAIYGAQHLPQFAHMKWVSALILGIAWFVVVIITQKVAMKSAIFGFIGLVASGILSGLLMVSIFTYVPSIYIIQALVSSGVLFFLLVMIGITTSYDLSKISHILMIALLAIIIVSLLNVFLFHSGMLRLIISIGSLLVFSVFTARDVQYLNQLSEYVTNENINGFAISGALELFVDFYNIFLDVLDIIMSVSDR